MAAIKDGCNKKYSNKRWQYLMMAVIIDGCNKSIKDGRTE
jgi:hypothetical protein